MTGDVQDNPRSAAAIFNHLERTYLGAIRVAALVFATLLILAAVWLAVTGSYKISRDVKSVKEAPSAVSAQELAQLDVLEIRKAAEEKNADPLAAEKRYYTTFAKRYFGLFKGQFERFRQTDDPVLNQQDFDDRFVHAAAHIQSVSDGTLDFASDKADLEALYATMAGAATQKATVDRLNAYRKSRKVVVTRKISGTRTETYCDYYSYYLSACITHGTREVPFVRTVEELRPPKGVISHIDLFSAYQERYISLLGERRQKNADDAANAREQILAGNVEGAIKLWTAVKVVGGFLALMFLFLLIALERHQRKIAAAIKAE